MWVVIGGGARRGSEEIGEEVGFWKDWEAKGATRGSRQGWGRDDSDGGDNDGWQEVFNQDVSKWDVLDDFFKALVDVSILRLGVGILKLRTREVVLLGSNVSENLEEVGWGSDKSG